MKLRKYIIVPILALTMTLGITTSITYAPMENVYAKNQDSYTFKSESTIIIKNEYDLDKIEKDKLDKVKHIIINSWSVDMKYLEIFPNVKWISLGKDVYEFDFGNREDNQFTQLSKIGVHEKNSYLKSINGILYSKHGDKLIYYPPKANSAAKVAKGTKIIGKGAFKNVPITSIKLASGVEEFEQEAFSGTKLKKIFLPASFRDIPKDAFSNTPLEEMQVSVKNKSFCTYEGALYNKGIDYLYYWPDGKMLEDLKFPDTLKYLNCDDIKTLNQAKTITIPKAMTSIINLGNAQKVALDPENTALHMVDGVLYSNVEESAKDAVYFDPKETKGNENSIVITKDVDYSSWPLNDIYPSVKKISFEEGTESIHKYVFYHFPNVEEIVLPKSLKDVGEAFVIFSYNEYNRPSGYGLRCLKSIDVHPENEIYTSQDGILYTKNLKRLLYYPMEKTSETYIMPEYVESIKDDAIYNKYIKTFTLGKRCRSNSYFNLYGELPNLKEYKVPSDSVYLSVQDGILYNYDKSVLISYPSKKKAANFEIPEFVDHVEYKSFQGAHIKKFIVSRSLHAFSLLDGDCETLAYEVLEGGLDYTYSICEMLGDVKIDSFEILYGNYEYDGRLYDLDESEFYDPGYVLYDTFKSKNY